MCEHFVSILQLDAEHCVGKWLYDCPLKDNRVFFRLGQGSILLG